MLIRKFDGTHITTRRLQKPDSEAKLNAFDMPRPVFDFYGGTYGVLLSCLPLKVWLSEAPPYVIKLQVAWADQHAVATFDML